MPTLTWTDCDEIGFRLTERFPNTDPLSVSFTDLQHRVLELADFDGIPSGSTEKILEAIQMAWL